jgi:hypothetical protein
MVEFSAEEAIIPNSTTFKPRAMSPGTHQDSIG